MQNSIGPFDVLCGRGGATNNNSGNIKFREVVASKQVEYLGSKKKEKTAIAIAVYEEVLASGGRFLKRDDATGAWVEVLRKKAITKASQALREGLDVKNKKVRQSKVSAKFTDEQRKQRMNVVTGKVAAPSSSPALVSLAGEENQVPELQEEEEEKTPAVFYQQRPVKAEVTEVAEV
ncbi:expressed unknown protein [Seminavis robusta]|uniref:DUF6824 domain-containing protein n=1 Tax=Seminavis robusta TaxID=568900 RepID=A0A9N8EZG7_9STRA|nr:expressed unknown protein [Seminavis robusta]|eukprot:Sro2318_g323080.1 n/a (177) ;mRNA; f:11534-12064